MNKGKKEQDKVQSGVTTRRGQAQISDEEFLKLQDTINKPRSRVQSKVQSKAPSKAVSQQGESEEEKFIKKGRKRKRSNKSTYSKLRDDLADNINKDSNEEGGEEDEGDEGGEQEVEQLEEEVFSFDEDEIEDKKKGKGKTPSHGVGLNRGGYRRKVAKDKKKFNAGKAFKSIKQKMNRDIDDENFEPEGYDIFNAGEVPDDDDNEIELDEKKTRRGRARYKPAQEDENKEVFGYKPILGRLGKDKHEVYQILSAGRRRKAKKVKQRFYPLIAQRRSSNYPSLEQRMINALFKKDITTAEGISSFLREQGVQLGRISEKMLKTLAACKVDNTGNLRVTDSLANNPLHAYLFVEEFITQTMSNDKLFLELLYRRSLRWLDQKDQPIFNISKVRNVIITTEPFDLEPETVIQKGYYQDFDGNFAAIGLESLEAPDKQELKKSIIDGSYQTKYEFNFEGKDYVACGTESAVVIHVKNLPKEKIEEMCKNLKVFKSFGNFDLVLRKINIKKDVVRYIDCKMKPEDFCPAFLILNKPKVFRILIKTDIDYNELFKMMDERLKNNETPYIDQDLFYWDTMQPFFDFLFVYTAMSQELRNWANYERKFKEWVEFYMSHRPILEIWKMNQLKLQKIYVSFYKSFSEKVNYDRLTKLSDEIDKYVKLRSKLMSDDSYPLIRTFLTTCPFCAGMIKNQFSSESSALPVLLQGALNNLINNKSNNMVETLQDIGWFIYVSGFNVVDTDKFSKTDKYFSFPYTLSPGAFLGDINKGLDRSPVLNNVYKLIMSHRRKNAAEKLDTRKIYDMVKNIDEKKKILIKNYIKQNAGDRLSDIERSNLAEEIFINLKQPEKDNLAAKVILLENKGGDVKNSDYNLSSICDKKINDALNKKMGDKLDIDIQKAKDQKALFDVMSNMQKRGTEFMTNADKDIDINGARNNWEKLTKDIQNDKDVTPDQLKYIIDVIFFSGSTQAKRSEMFKDASDSPGNFVIEYSKDVYPAAVGFINKDYKLGKMPMDAKDKYQFSEYDRVPELIYSQNYVDKENGENDFADCELAWTSFEKAVRKFSFRWQGMLQGDMKNKEERIHPTQKPVALYKWILANYTKDGDLILDTHVGSASSLIACEDMGLKYVGFEIDKTYYSESKKRLDNHKAQISIIDLMAGWRLP